MILTDTHLFFYYGHEIYSNFHRTPNQLVDPVLDAAFDSSEQHFMGLKARFFGDNEALAKIIATKEPRDVKALGRLIKGYNDFAWSTVRKSMMTYSCYLKFSQNPAFKIQLLATENLTLVEASPTDKIWGIGLSVEDAAAGKPWNGQNLLGQALMEVREMIRK